MMPSAAYADWYLQRVTPALSFTPMQRRRFQILSAPQAAAADTPPFLLKASHFRSLRCRRRRFIFAEAAARGAADYRFAPPDFAMF